MGVVGAANQHECRQSTPWKLLVHWNGILGMHDGFMKIAHIYMVLLCNFVSVTGKKLMEDNVTEGISDRVLSSAKRLADGLHGMLRTQHFIQNL